MAKIRLATILAPVWAIAVADKTVLKPDMNLILSAIVIKQRIWMKNLTV